MDTKVEVVAIYKLGAERYEIDHLGVCSPALWGLFVVYREDEQVAEFEIEEAALHPDLRPTELPVSRTELIRLAQETVAATADDVR